MTIDDDFYMKLGRMTIAFGELDFMVAYLAANMARRLGEAEPQRFTARKLDDIKSWARKYESQLGHHLVDDLVQVSGEVKALLLQRQDAVHGLWLQEDGSSAWVMKLPKGATSGIRSKTDAASVEALTGQAQRLAQRVSEAAVGILKLS